MQITAACPKCSSRYQFDSALVGQKIRCPNPQCRAVFVVQEAVEEVDVEIIEEPAPAPAKPAKPAARDRRAPTFESDSGEHPPLPASPPAPAPAPAAADGPREADWSKLPPPPVRKREEVVVGQVEEIATAEPPVDPGHATPEEVLALMGLAPATAPAPAATADDDYTLPQEIVEVNGEQAYEAEVREHHRSEYEHLLHQYKAPRRRWIWVVLAFFVLVLAGGTAGVFIYARKQTSKQLVQNVESAEDNLAKRRYSSAVRDFDDLLKKNSNHKDVARWRFQRDLAQQLNDAFEGKTNAVARRLALQSFIQNAKSSGQTETELLKKYEESLRLAFERFAEDLIGEANTQADAKDFDAAETSYKNAENNLTEVKQYGTASEELTKRFATVRAKIDEGKKYAKFLTQFNDILKTVSPEARAQAEKFAKDSGYLSRPEAMRAIDEIDKKLLALIVFKAEEKAAVPPAAEGLTSVVLGPNLDKVPANPNVVFAVARGVLYALADAKGQLLWATRVGIDTSSLPLRVPGSGNMPATIIVPSATGKGLVARDLLTGKARWFQELPATVRGQPVLIEDQGRLIVPLSDATGTVLVIDARSGSRLGSIQLQQRLGPGATLQPGTSRVFIPADRDNVFVLDANPPLRGGANNLLELEGPPLATHHGPGSLRSEPIVVGGVDDAGALSGVGYLILAQSDGFSNMKLRSFELRPVPREGGAGQTVQLTPGVVVEESLPGWSWFAPVSNQEEIAVVTDVGALAVLGINQKQNVDQSLFRLIVHDAKEKAGAIGRGIVVHTEENNYWYIADGELRYERRGIDRKDGQKLALRWKAKVGTPLHAAQISADRSTLFVVTQTSSPPAWLASAVNAQTGEILWQRPLGLAPQGDPVKFGGAVYQIDRGAGVYQVDPKAVNPPAGQEWDVAVGQVLAAPRQDIAGEPHFLPHADGKMAFVIFATEEGHKLNAIVLAPGQKASNPISVPLPAGLAGEPLLIDKAVIVPLNDGALYRWNVGDKDLKRGPDWRAIRAATNARAFVALVGKDGVLTSDGVRNLALYQWSAGADHVFKYQVQVPDRIIANPVVLPGKDGPRVAVADAGGRVHLLEGDPLSVSTTTRWDMRALRKGNEITAGPYLAEHEGQPRLLVVADRNTIVCLVPDVDGRREAWSYRVKGDGVQSRLLQIGSALVLGDVSGRYEALGVADGKPLAAPYPAFGPLPAAPATAPVEFGPDRLFAPLTDGTALLIPTEALAPKK